MAVITTGAHPKALIGSLQKQVDQNPSEEPLADVAKRFVGPSKKPPKLKKKAFGENQAGAAFRK